MSEGAGKPPDAIPPQRKLFPGAQSQTEKVAGMDVDKAGKSLLARERALPELVGDLQSLTSEYYAEFVKVADALEPHPRRVWPGQKPGHFYNSWEDKVAIKNDDWDTFIFKSQLYFDKKSVLLERPELKSYEARVWELRNKDEKKHNARVSIEFGDNAITSITLEGMPGQFAELAAKNSGFDPPGAWGYDLFFGQFMHKNFMFDEASKLQLILLPEPKIMVYNTDIHKKTHFSSYSFDKNSEEPVFRGNLPTTAKQKRFMVGGAYQRDTLTPAQFKDVVQGALMVLPGKA